MQSSPAWGRNATTAARKSDWSRLEVRINPLNHTSIGSSCTSVLEHELADDRRQLVERIL
jgi:hypothetical protein